ncbi:MAG: hydratase [Phreatobacter sp.]|uniref:MaoC/PaaZ C-terminal domain-containing protein n=1 Tax=Phreatobacter sp. TaxID=1966341 RepID=UPI001A4A9758|nr:MaoC/PaaZ C-terminal domain-containing protein [Phreatobacter sp.]MBL8571478.1 hydratase [Phreatobacter sp.]
MIAAGPLFSETRTLTQADFDLFARVSGDDNPIHVDADFSARTRFGRTVSHGMLLYTVLWGLMRRHVPGARQTAQTLMFPAPAFAGEALVFSGIVETTTADGARLALRIVRESDGETVCEASANVTTEGGDEGR